MRKINVVILALIAMICFGCKPVCRTVVTSIDSEKRNWFGPEIRLGWGRSSDKIENYLDHTIYFDQVDVDDLSNCESCRQFKVKLKHYIEINWAPFLASICKRVSVVNNKTNADYVAQIKIVSITESRPILKMPLLGTGSDIFEFWVRIVNIKSNRVVFGYKAGGPMETEVQIRAVAREFASALEGDETHS